MKSSGTIVAHQNAALSVIYPMLAGTLPKLRIANRGNAITKKEMGKRNKAREELNRLIRSITDPRIHTPHVLEYIFCPCARDPSNEDVLLRTATFNVILYEDRRRPYTVIDLFLSLIVEPERTIGWNVDRVVFANPHTEVAFAKFPFEYLI